MQDNIHLNKDTQLKLTAGIKKVADILRPSYGSAGSNVIVETSLYPYHMIVNDAKIIVDSIKLQDKVENIGKNILAEVCDKSDKESGDGRKTTAILTDAIIQEGLKQTVSSMDIKRSLDECLPIIDDSLSKQTKQITENEVGIVATIASENKVIGSLLQEVYQKIGKDGIVEIDNSGTFDTFYEIKEGVRLRNCGFVSQNMANDGQKAVYKKPQILITKQKIATLQDIDPLFRALSNKGITELVIFCDEIDNSVFQALSFTHSQGIFKTLIIKAPTLWKDWLYEDFAKITGATIVEPQTGINYKNVTLSHLGTCEKIITTKEETTVIGIKDVSQHIKNLEEQNTQDSKLRLAWLTTKAAILRLGANSESELKYLSLKARDARNASYLALKEGVVPGGGVALNNCIKDLPNTIGGAILKEALQVPLKQIQINLEVKTGITNWGDNIIDAVIVTRNAIKNAISVASTVITGKVTITLNKNETIQ